MNFSTRQLEEMIFVACKLEATARKPGNVHPDASFEDSSYDDFIKSAQVIAPILAKANSSSIGTSILEAVQATRVVVGQNTNLGIILLLAPLASLQRSEAIGSSMNSILDGMTVQDSKQIYRAINLANPSGMGKSKFQDLSDEPTEPFRDIMSSVLDKDSIARAYSNGYTDILPPNETEIQNEMNSLITNWEKSIISWQLKLMSTIPDTLILRKCGRDIAQKSADMAKEILDAGWPESNESQKLFDHFDRWLRADDNQRNPGTTADLIAAKLFIVLRETYSQPETQNFIQEILNDVE